MSETMPESCQAKLDERCHTWFIQTGYVESCQLGFITLVSAHPFNWAELRTQLIERTAYIIPELKLKASTQPIDVIRAVMLREAEQTLGDDFENTNNFAELFLDVTSAIASDRNVGCIYRAERCFNTRKDRHDEDECPSFEVVTSINPGSFVFEGEQVDLDTMHKIVLKTWEE